jgi:hypothetical protein
LDDLLLPGSSRHQNISSLVNAKPVDPGNARRKVMARTFKVMLVALVVLVLAGSAFAFAAANTVPASSAGYAATVVSGYTVSALKYDLNVDDPTLVDAITFSISPTTGSVVAAVVKIQTATAGTWKDCTLTAGTAPAMLATCTYGALQLVDVTALNVVASSTTDPAP